MSTTNRLDNQPKPNGTHKPLRVGIAGLGRSGWNIHVHALRDLTHLFRVTAAMDPDAARRKQAADELGCDTYETFEAMLDSADLDVMVVASPNHLHAPHSIASMARGLHVVCEKPFATITADAEEMIEASESSGLILAPFQNRRFEAHYRKIVELINSGDLGEVLQIRMCWHRFTRRWDWQASRKFSGGALFNNGTHLIDQALPLLGDAEPEVFLDLRRGLSVGDADEHMKMVLRAEGAPTIDIEYSNAVAYEQDRWHISGTGGGLVGTPEQLRWKTVDWSAMPSRPLDLGPAANRKYPSEQIEWTHHEWSHPADEPHPYALFYMNFHAAITRGEALVVTPATALRYVRLLEQCVNRYEPAH